MLLGWFEGVGGFGDALEERFTLEVEEDGGLLDLAALEDALNDLIAVQWATLVAQDTSNDISYSALAITPDVERINTAADEDEALVFDELVVDGLLGDVTALESAFLDALSNLAKVQRLPLIQQDDVDLVADILGING